MSDHTEFTPTEIPGLELMLIKDRLQLAMKHLERVGPVGNELDNRANWCMSIIHYCAAVDHGRKALNPPIKQPQRHEDDWLPTRHAISHILQTAVGIKSEMHQVNGHTEIEIGWYLLPETHGGKVIRIPWTQAMNHPSEEFLVSKLRHDIERYMARVVDRATEITDELGINESDPNLRIDALVNHSIYEKAIKLARSGTETHSP